MYPILLKETGHDGAHILAVRRQRSAWFTEYVPGQLRLHREPLSQHSPLLLYAAKKKLVLLLMEPSQKCEL